MNSQLATHMQRFSFLVLALLVSACASVPEQLMSSPRVNLSDVKVVGLGFDNQTFLLSFDVENPNSFPLPVNSINYGVKLGGQRFASGETVCDFTIPANGSTTFAISVDLNLLRTAPQLLSLVRDASRHDISYELDGRLSVDIPFAPPLKYRNSGTIQLSANRL